MNPNHSTSIRRIKAVKAAIRYKGRDAKEVAALIYLNLRSTQRYLAYLVEQKRAYIEEWRPCGAALAQVYRLGERESLPKPPPATRTQHHRTYRAKLVSDPERNDLHLAKRRARGWADKAASRPNDWTTPLGAAVREVRHA